MELRYIVSDASDHSKKICRDTGPKYAASLGLTYGGMDALSATEPGAFIIDEITDGEEIDRIEAFIRRESKAVLLKVGDPFWRRATRPKTRSRYTRLVEDCCALPNVALLSMYEPREWLADLITHCHPKYLALPYPYVEQAEQALSVESFSARHDRALFTGATSRRKYPARARLRWCRRLLKRYRESFDVLGHPGYPDIGETLRHGLIFEEFVKFVATYKYFFVDPSRADLELLKFTECGYAGCVPVGVPATSLPPAVQELFLTPAALVAARHSIPAAHRDAEHFERALLYRQLMNLARDADDLRARLEEFVQKSF